MKVVEFVHVKDANKCGENSAQSVGEGGGACSQNNRKCATPYTVVAL